MKKIDFTDKLQNVLGFIENKKCSSCTLNNCYSCMTNREKMILKKCIDCSGKECLTSFCKDNLEDSLSLTVNFWNWLSAPPVFDVVSIALNNVQDITR